MHTQVVSRGKYLRSVVIRQNGTHQFCYNMQSCMPRTTFKWPKVIRSQETKQPIMFTCNRDREHFAKGKNYWLQMLSPQLNEMSMNVGAQPLFEARQTCCLHCSRGPTICLRAPRISACHKKCKSIETIDSFPI